MANDLPVHPARLAAQQGLEAPQEANTPNPYFVPSAALQGYNANQQPAQAPVAQPAGLGNIQVGPAVQPQQVQAEQVADALVRGQLDQQGLQAAIQNGELDPMVAEAAMGMAQQFLQADQVRNEQTMGLGGSGF